MPAKCENCGCCAPKITPEGANKIYRASLTGKQREANAALDIDLDGERADLAAPGEDAQEDGRELAGQEVAPDPANDKKKKRRKKRMRDLTLMKARTQNPTQSPAPAPARAPTPTQT